MQKAASRGFDRQQQQCGDYQQDPTNLISCRSLAKHRQPDYQGDQTKARTDSRSDISSSNLCINAVDKQSDRLQQADDCCKSSTASKNYKASPRLSGRRTRGTTIASP